MIGLFVGKARESVDLGCAGSSVTGVPSHDAETGKESKRHELEGRLAQTSLVVDMIDKRLIGRALGWINFPTLRLKR